MHDDVMTTTFESGSHGRAQMASNERREPFLELTVIQEDTGVGRHD